MQTALIIDDHLLFADGLKMLLQQHFQITVETSASVDRWLKEPARLAAFSIVIVDLHMPGLSGFNFLEACKQRGLETNLVVISGSEDQGDIERAINLGARAFIPKDASTEEVIEGINSVMRGEYYLPAKWEAQIDLSKRRAAEVKTHYPVKITHRQIQVLKMIRDGLRNKQIALVLGISESAVKSHVEILLREMQVKNRTACVVEGIKLGIISARQSTS